MLKKDQFNDIHIYKLQDSQYFINSPLAFGWRESELLERDGVTGCAIDPGEACSVSSSGASSVPR